MNKKWISIFTIILILSCLFLFSIGYDLYVTIKTLIGYL